MANSYRIDELTARLKVILDADARLDDNLSETPTVYDQVPKPEMGTPTYRIYIEPVMSELYSGQPKTAMSFIGLAHTLRLWVVVGELDAATARSDWSKLLMNVLLILADNVDDGSSYWYAGMPQTIAHSASHPNLDYAGDVRFRVGYIDFRFLQDLTV